MVLLRVGDKENQAHDELEENLLKQDKTKMDYQRKEQKNAERCKAKRACLGGDETGELEQATQAPRLT